MTKSFVFVNWEEKDTISIFDHGFLYSDAVFDTYRIFNQRSFFAKQHLNRLLQSLEKVSINIKINVEFIEKFIFDEYKKSGIRDAFVRIIVTRGQAVQGILSPCEPTVIVIITEREFTPLKKVNVAFSKVPKFSLDSFGRGIKSLTYSLTAEMLAKEKLNGYEDIIFLNELGFVSEASTSNVFIVKDEQIFTSKLKDGCLDGVTRRIILENFDVVEKRLTKQDLYEADEVFLTGTVNFVVSVKRLDNIDYSSFVIANSVFNKLQKFI